MSLIKKIEKLTPEQEARFPEFRDKWLNIGLSTKPANRQEAERGIVLAYEAAGLKPPQKIVWCGSPLSQGLTRAIITDQKRVKKLGDSVGDSVRDSVRGRVWDRVWVSVWASVGDSVGASVRDSVRASVWASVGASVGASVRDSVWDSVGDSVRDSVRASVRGSVGDSVRDSVWDRVWDRVWDSVYGQHEAGFLVFYDYFSQVLELTGQTERLNGLWLQAKNAGWFLPHEKICWVSERHNILERDERGRIHSLAGPAIAYPDGWAIYAVHGVRVPEWIITKPNDITPEKIDDESNSEIRRVMLDRFGYDKYLIQSNARELHRDEFGILYRKELPDDEAITMVKVIDSTPKYFTDKFSREEWERLMARSAVISDVQKQHPKAFASYFIRVPNDMQRAKQAVAWTFKMAEEEYKPLFES